MAHASGANFPPCVDKQSLLRNYGTSASGSALVLQLAALNAVGGRAPANGRGRRLMFSLLGCVKETQHQHVANGSEDDLRVLLHVDSSRTGERLEECGALFESWLKHDATMRQVVQLAARCAAQGTACNLQVPLGSHPTARALMWPRNATAVASELQLRVQSCSFRDGDEDDSKTGRDSSHSCTNSNTKTRSHGKHRSRSTAAPRLCPAVLLTTFRSGSHVGAGGGCGLIAAGAACINPNASAEAPSERRGLQQHAATATTLSALSASRRNMPYSSEGASLACVTAVSSVPCNVTMLQYPGRVLFQNARSLLLYGDLVGKPLGAVLLRQLLSQGADNGTMVNSPGRSQPSENLLERMLEAVHRNEEFEAVVQVNPAAATLRNLWAVAEEGAEGDAMFPVQGDSATPLNVTAVTSLGPLEPDALEKALLDDLLTSEIRPTKASSSRREATAGCATQRRSQSFNAPPLSLAHLVLMAESTGGHPRHVPPTVPRSPSAARPLYPRSNSSEYDMMPLPHTRIGSWSARGHNRNNSPAVNCLRLGGASGSRADRFAGRSQSFSMARMDRMGLMERAAAAAVASSSLNPGAGVCRSDAARAWGQLGAPAQPAGLTSTGVVGGAGAVKHSSGAAVPGATSLIERSRLSVAYTSSLFTSANMSMHDQEEPQPPPHPEMPQGTTADGAVASSSCGPLMDEEATWCKGISAADAATLSDRCTVLASPRRYVHAAGGHSTTGRSNMGGGGGGGGGGGDGMSLSLPRLQAGQAQPAAQPTGTMMLRIVDAANAYASAKRRRAPRRAASTLADTLIQASSGRVGTTTADASGSFAMACFAIGSSAGARSVPRAFGGGAAAAAASYNIGGTLSCSPHPSSSGALTQGAGNGTLSLPEIGTASPCTSTEAAVLALLAPWHQTHGDVLGGAGGGQVTLRPRKSASTLCLVGETEVSSCADGLTSCGVNEARKEQHGLEQHGLEQHGLELLQRGDAEGLHCGDMGPMAVGAGHHVHSHSLQQQQQQQKAVEENPLKPALLLSPPSPTRGVTGSVALLPRELQAKRPPRIDQSAAGCADEIRDLEPGINSRTSCSNSVLTAAPAVITTGQSTMDIGLGETITGSFWVVRNSACGINFEDSPQPQPQVQSRLLHQQRDTGEQQGGEAEKEQGAGRARPPPLVLATRTVAGGNSNGTRLAGAPPAALSLPPPLVYSSVLTGGEARCAAPQHGHQSVTGMVVMGAQVEAGGCGGGGGSGGGGGTGVHPLLFTQDSSTQGTYSGIFDENVTLATSISECDIPALAGAEVVAAVIANGRRAAAAFPLLSSPTVRMMQHRSYSSALQSSNGREESAVTAALAAGATHEARLRSAFAAAGQSPGRSTLLPFGDAKRSAAATRGLMLGGSEGGEFRNLVTSRPETETTPTGSPSDSLAARAARRRDRRHDPVIRVQKLLTSFSQQFDSASGADTPVMDRRGASIVGMASPSLGYKMTHARRSGAQLQQVGTQRIRWDERPVSPSDVLHTVDVDAPVALSHNNSVQPSAHVSRSNNSMAPAAADGGGLASHTATSTANRSFLGSSMPAPMTVSWQAPPLVPRPGRLVHHKIHITACDPPEGDTGNHCDEVQAALSPDGTAPGAACVSPSMRGHRGPLTLVLTQIDVSEQVEAQTRLSRLLEQEHKVLESIFPRHVIEYMTLSNTANTPGPATASDARGLNRSTTGANRPRSDSCLSGNSGCLLRCPTGSAPRLASLATWHPCVTIMFCDIVGFTTACHATEAINVMAFLNDLFSRFDSLVDIYKVYKVETIGDCYMVAGGLVAYDEDGYKSVISGHEDPLHAVRTMEFAKAMVRASREVRMPHTGEPVQLRVGLHSGPITSGVVGDRMPRFCLFGDTVNVASRMESTCRPGHIHVSAATQSRLANEAWRDLGMTEVKGKGEMQTFEWGGDVDGLLGGDQVQRVLGLYL